MDDGAMGWPIDVPALRSSLGDAGLSADATARIAGSARPALMLAATPVDEDAIPLGATKIGGRPDLPAHLPWPERPAYPNAVDLAREALDGAERFHADAGLVPPWMSAEDGAAMLAENRRLKAETRAFLRSLDVEDKDLDTAFSYGFTPEEASEVAREAMTKAQAVANPFLLAFLAQIDLAPLADRPGFDPALPREGRLYLFYDLFALPPSYSPASAVGLRVVHDGSPPGELSRTELPEPLRRIADIAGTTLAPATVALRPAATAVPQHASAAGKLGLADEDAQAYGEWLLASPGWPGDGTEAKHQLGGWPRASQPSMEGTAQLASNGIDAGSSEAFRSPEGRRLLAEASAWRLMFQLGPDERIGNRLPGALNILVREEDLAPKRFDRAWAVYEQD